MTRVAAVQMNSKDNVAENLKAVEQKVETAVNQGARLVALPENFAFMGQKDTDKWAISEVAGQGPIQDFLSQLARKHKIWLVGGTLPLRAKDVSEKRVYAASLVWNEEGKVVARYDKIHLFDVEVEKNGEKYLESETILPGDKVVSVESPFGKLGFSVCYDVRFPELYRLLFGEGVQILFIPSAFTEITGKAHWEVLLRARAIENFCYVIAPNQAGVHANGRQTFGDSMIIDPWGKVLASLPSGEGVIVADLDLAYLNDIRARVPVEKHRKFFIEGNS